MNESPDPMFMPKSYVARQEYYFRARPDKIFAALTEPKSLVKWFLSEAKIDRKQAERSRSIGWEATGWQAS